MRLAVIPGDGIGPEVIDEALKVLTEVVPDVATTTYDLGAARWHSTGELLPESVLSELREHDAILLGAVGDPSVPSGILERGLLLRLRFELDHHVNLRPARLYTGVRSPLAAKSEIDMVVVREGTEGPYAGVGGHLRKDTPHEIATEVSVNTAFGVERVVRDAFDACRAPRRASTSRWCTRRTCSPTPGSLWSRLVEEVSLEHPDVAVSYQHIDATTIHLVTDPGRFDVIVTDNLFGDILTDLAAAVTGGIGLAASGNLDVSRRNPSMFEPVHGSAPDIAGQGIADPTAAVLSVALLLDHLGQHRGGPPRSRPRWRSTWRPATTRPRATPSRSATAWPRWSAARPLRRTPDSRRAAAPRGPSSIDITMTGAGTGLRASRYELARECNVRGRPLSGPERHIRGPFCTDSRGIPGAAPTSYFSACGRAM